MPVDERRRAPLSRYRCDLRYVVGSRASAYGYTLTVWFTGMVLSHAVGLPSPPLAFSFFLGAVLGFGGCRGRGLRWRDGGVRQGVELRPALGELPLPFGGVGSGSGLVLVRART
jgi:hypothetical protein